VVDRAGDGQHHATGPVGRAPVIDDAPMRRATHRADRPGDLPPERVTPIQQLVEQREDVVRRRVDVHPDLVDDDRLLCRQVGATQDRVQGELADSMERHAELLGRHLGAVDRQLAVGAGIDRSADALDDLRQRARLRVVARALEHEVLQQMRQPGVSLVLVARADRDEDRNARRAGPRHRLGHDAKPAG
jgi:hypothetical protein